MKKIVAIVLSLVMVLGLATTAFGATTKYTAWFANTAASATDTTAAHTAECDLPVVNAAVAPVAPAVNGVAANYYFGGVYWVAGTADDCDLYFTVKGKTTPVMYLKQVGTPAYLGVGALFTNFGKDCGQNTYVANPLVKYYTYTDAAGVAHVYAEAAALSTATDMLLVDGKLVGVVATDLGTVVPHSWTFTRDAAGTPVSAKCEDCGAVATVYTKFTAVPAGAKYITEGAYFLVVGASAPAAGDKVESAQTFDAGIAMYVGMSVMAAAGSAVVLKKKD